MCKLYTYCDRLQKQGSSLCCAILKDPGSACQVNVLLQISTIPVGLSSPASMTLVSNVCIVSLPCDEGSTLEYILPISQAPKSALTLYTLHDESRGRGRPFGARGVRVMFPGEAQHQSAALRLSRS